MTAQPTRDQLRADVELGKDLTGTYYADEDADYYPAMKRIFEAVPQLLDQLDQAEADRDWNLRSSRIAKKERIEANARAERAEQRARELTQEVREERGAARDQMEQVRIRDARIKAVRDVLDQAEASINRHPAYTFSGQRMDPIVNGADIRRALGT